MRSASSFAGIATTMKSRCIALCDRRRALSKRRFRVMISRRFDTRHHETDFPKLATLERQPAGKVRRYLDTMSERHHIVSASQRNPSTSCRNRTEPPVRLSPCVATERMAARSLVVSFSVTTTSVASAWYACSSR